VASSVSLASRLLHRLLQCIRSEGFMVCGLALQLLSQVDQTKGVNESRRLCCMQLPTSCSSYPPAPPPRGTPLLPAPSSSSTLFFQHPLLPAPSSSSTLFSFSPI
jgi:hypothetical protein